jgi:hypothetical protein
MRPATPTAALPPTTAEGATTPNEELAANVSRFEMLVAEHSDYLRRIELLLDEIESTCGAELKQ